MGLNRRFEVLGGGKEFLLNKDFATDGYHFNMFEKYVTEDKFGKKIVEAGTPVPANDETCLGLAFKTYKVDEDDFNGAIVYRGLVKESQLPVTLTAPCKEALEKHGINFR
jgi:hypothetical protein